MAHSLSRMSLGMYRWFLPFSFLGTGSGPPFAPPPWSMVFFPHKPLGPPHRGAPSGRALRCHGEGCTQPSSASHHDAQCRGMVSVAGLSCRVAADDHHGLAPRLACQAPQPGAEPYEGRSRSETPKYEGEVFTGRRSLGQTRPQSAPVRGRVYPTVRQKRLQNAPTWDRDAHQEPECRAETLAGRPNAGQGSSIHSTPRPNVGQSRSRVLQHATEVCTERPSVGREHSQSTLALGRNTERPNVGQNHSQSAPVWGGNVPKAP